MEIYGFQKLTLLDFPEKTACTLFTGGCNMRCPFCHNSPLVRLSGEDETFTEEEIFSYLDKRHGLLDGVAITGGEPLLQKDIVPFIKKIKDTGYLVKLDTNGTFPEPLKELTDKKLVDYIAMDIKNCKEKYSITAGVKVDIDTLQKSIDIIMNSGIDYEFRTTVVKEFHEVEDIIKISEWIRGADKYYLQCFKDSGNILEDGCSAHSEETLREMAKQAGKNVCFCDVRGV